jgi:hypothetical protein
VEVRGSENRTSRPSSRLPASTQAEAVKQWAATGIQINPYSRITSLLGNFGIGLTVPMERTLVPLTCLVGQTTLAVDNSSRPTRVNLPVCDVHAAGETLGLRGHGYDVCNDKTLSNLQTAADQTKA